MSSSSPTDFIGVLVILGGEIAEDSVKFANAYPILHAARLFVVPGLYKVAILLLKRNKMAAGLAFSSGIREDRIKMVGFKGSYKYRYTGMMSGTNAPVGNAILEAWLNAKRRKSRCGDEGLRRSMYYRESIALGRQTMLQCAKLEPNLRLGKKIHTSNVCTIGYGMSIILQVLL